jgi:hypothetical protein
LKTIPTLPKTLRTGDPQVGQDVKGSSWNDCTTSKFLSQLSQWYSYVGNWPVLSIRHVCPAGSLLERVPMPTYRPGVP